MLAQINNMPRVAYFSMEIAFHEAIPTYSGGLGVLAGDAMFSAADLELPIVAVTLASHEGYFHQSLDGDGRQQESAENWNIAEYARSLDAKVCVHLEGEKVWVGAWLYELKGHMNGCIPIILLDTDLMENSEPNKALTNRLYGGDERYRLKQEAILGIGGERMLQALSFTVIRYHMNECHSALLVSELLKRFRFNEADVREGETTYNLPRVRELCCFTTHTPIEAGHDRFSYELVTEVLERELELDVIKKFAGNDNLNMTRLAMNCSEFINGVAKKHADVSRDMFPGYHINAITNGVHPRRWVCPELAALFDDYLPGWCHETELLRNVDVIPSQNIWQVHQNAKQVLINHVNRYHGVLLDLEIPILGFARRMTSYKRADLLFSNIDTLKRVAARFPFQIILGGKAHPHDDEGKRLIEQLHSLSKELQYDIKIVFLENYDIAQAKMIVAGSDIWLNTPLRPYEASGTSGMKAAINGVLNLSVLDGWWIEGCIEGQTGWAIGSESPSENGKDALSLYQKLEHIVLPTYYEKKNDWLKMMITSIQKNGTYFNSHRMMRRYVCEAYL
tara:strand:- start:878 stop:2566 length:1689 start_codon:yes stop_codon:yes gene_type:complete